MIYLISILYCTLLYKADCFKVQRLISKYNSVQYRMLQRKLCGNCKISLQGQQAACPVLQNSKSDLDMEGQVICIVTVYIFVIQ